MSEKEFLQTLFEYAAKRNIRVSPEILYGISKFGFGQGYFTKDNNIKLESSWYPIKVYQICQLMYDSRRGFAIFALKYNHQWVSVLCMAGREYDDYVEEYCFDLELRDEAIDDVYNKILARYPEAADIYFPEILRHELEKPIDVEFYDGIRYKGSGIWEIIPD